jgi:hypothetical protein
MTNMKKSKNPEMDETGMFPKETVERLMEPYTKEDILVAANALFRPSYHGLMDYVRDQVREQCPDMEVSEDFRFEVMLGEDFEDIKIFHLGRDREPLTAPLPSNEELAKYDAIHNTDKE